MIRNGQLTPGTIGPQWLTPFDPKVLGGLRGQVNQYSDSTGTILTPKRPPKTMVTGFTYIPLP